MRETSATLETAALQYGTTGAGRHTLHETVDMRTVAFLWLVRSLWHRSNFLIALIVIRQYSMTVTSSDPSALPCLFFRVYVSMFSPIIQAFSTV